MQRYMSGFCAIYWIPNRCILLHPLQPSVTGSVWIPTDSIFFFWGGDAVLSCLEVSRKIAVFDILVFEQKMSAATPLFINSWLHDPKFWWKTQVFMKSKRKKKLHSATRIPEVFIIANFKKNLLCSWFLLKTNKLTLNFHNVGYKGIQTPILISKEHTRIKLNVLSFKEI